MCMFDWYIGIVNVLVSEVVYVYCGYEVMFVDL